MRYDTRNRANLDKLAPNTRKAAYAWYEYCIKIGADILIYETIRTIETQKKYLADGKSKTLKSYHLVGQALDFVPVNASGAMDYNGYGSALIKRAITEAKRLGFEWGGDWKTFVDKPHLQFNYEGYGTDKVLDVVKESDTKEDEDKMKLTTSQKTILVAALKGLLEQKVITDTSWIEKAEKGTLTVSELTLLNIIILTRKVAK
ncbi:Peptidoglycan L-alanyl-D-glutamate endopeptidase CwlK precursor [compost metagenome]